MIITPINKRNIGGSGVNPNSSINGETGIKIVNKIIAKVVSTRYLPGLLLKKGFLVRTTNTIRTAEITDSRNQPVLNCILFAFNNSSKTPKVK